jgi:CDP-6-deoxy-D-xylo-4-hexulose-3-dehydrase
MPYSLAHNSWGEEELDALNRVIQIGRYTMGSEVAKFEREFAEFFRVKHAVMVNSGSSANLMMLSALRYDDRFGLQPNDEVIVPAVSWSTTYFPVDQNQFKLVFVDVDLDTLNISVDRVIDAITEKTKVVFAVNLLGNPADLVRLRQVCDSKGIILLEDNCESLGAGVNNKYCGTWGLMGSFSFFFSHHMQTMEGGMIVTDDLKLAQMMRSLRAHGWLRDLPDENLVCNKLGDPFQDSFRFALPGYCVRPLEMSGAVGREQLKKVQGQLDQRSVNAQHFRREISTVPELMGQTTNGYSSWFGFGIVLQGKALGHRKRIIQELAKAEVETRPIVAGNFLRNPVCKLLNHRVHGALTNADIIHDNGFFLGNDSRILSVDITLAVNTIKNYISRIT